MYGAMGRVVSCQTTIGSSSPIFSAGRPALAVEFFNPRAGYFRDAQNEQHEDKGLRSAGGSRIGPEKKFRRYCHNPSNQSGKSEDYPVVLYEVRLIALPTYALAPGGQKENHPTNGLLAMRAFHFMHSVTEKVFVKRQTFAPGFLTVLCRATRERATPRRPGHVGPQQE